MKTWLLSIAALKANHTATTLFFSDNSYISTIKDIQPNRLKQPALLNVSPNDGGVFKLFNSASIGEIELHNNDNALDYLLDYALDGRKATLTFIDDDNSEKVYLTATVDKMSERGSVMLLSLKAFSESLANPFPLDDYGGAGGLDGSVVIKGKSKPVVFGVCSNITPVLVHESKLIYQVSSRIDTVITAVYDEGVRWVNYQTSAAASVGASSIALDSGAGGIASGTLLALIASETEAIFFVTTASALANEATGTVSITQPLLYAVDDNSPVELAGFYADTTALQGSTIADVWGGFQGYFRLADNPSGVITCDAMSIDNTLAFDVFKSVAASIDVLDFTPTVDITNKTAINALGAVGVFVDSSKPARELLDLITKSIGGYYWFAGDVIKLGLFDVPAAPVFTIIDAQIVSISRLATGMGGNGVPVQGFKFGYDKVETTQTTLAGSVSKVWRSRLTNQFRYARRVIAATKTYRLLSEIINVDGVLKDRAKVFEVIDRLNALSSVRRDAIEVVAQFKQLPKFDIGDTVRVITPRMGYSAGRDLLIMGYSVDIKRKKVTLKGVG